MNITNITHSLWSSATATLLAVILLLVSYVLLEPVVTRAATDTDTFIITQSVTAEIAISNVVADVAMAPSIGGVAGGTATGQTQVIVTTNNNTGYYMTLEFSTSTAMQGNTQGGVIQNYTPTSGVVPDYTFSVGANTAEFAYSVSASTTSDIDTTFRNNGAVCNNNTGGDVADRCWAAPSTTAGVAAAETIITTTSGTPSSGSTSTVKFQVQITSNPAPAVPVDTYTATATLTAVTNP